MFCTLYPLLSKKLEQSFLRRTNLRVALMIKEIQLRAVKIGKINWIAFLMFLETFGSVS